jgi:hypothetical protein
MSLESVVYNCCWPSPAQSFSVPSPGGLMTTFYCLSIETPPIWRARSTHLYPPGKRWPCYSRRHWVPFLSPPTTRRATMEVFDPASTRVNISISSSNRCLNLSSDLFQSHFSTRIFYFCIVFLTHVTCPTHCILLDLITLILCVERNQLWSWGLCNFLHSTVTSSPGGPNVQWWIYKCP